MVQGGQLCALLSSDNLYRANPDSCGYKQCLLLVLRQINMRILMFDITRFTEIESNPTRFRLLEKIPFSAEASLPIKLREAAGDEIALALLDIQTTGFTAGSDEVIEIGLVALPLNRSWP